MKIIYIHQYFKTYADGGSSRSFYLAQALIAHGHKVEMITSHNDTCYKKVNIEGITVHYLPVYYDNTLGFIGRIYAFIKFAVKAYQLASSIKGVDLCYATSTPLSVGLIAILLKKLHNIPYYFEVRDLWPTAPIEMGSIRNLILRKILYKLERWIYRQADEIIALSPGIAQEISKKIAGSDRIHVIPNMADCDFFQPQEKNSKSLPGKNYTNTFNIIYFGAVGKVNQLSYLIEVALFFQEKLLSNVKFLIVGKGNDYGHVQALAQAYQLTNIKFLPHADKYRLREIMKATDAVYISFAQKPVLETSSPNKFFDALAAGKLCITNTSGWIRECIEEAGCGFFANATQPEMFYRNLLPYLASKRKLKEAKEAARHLAERQFSRELLTKEFLTLFPRQRLIAASEKEMISDLEK